MSQDRNGKRGHTAEGMEKAVRSPSGEGENVRQLALEAMLAIMEQGEFCDRVLHQMLAEHASLPQRDKAFLMRLVEGSVERCIELDYVIDRYSKLPVREQKPVVREILRLAVYQILYMDVKHHAACNEAVRLTCSNHLMPLRGFVNGVLRNIVRFYEDTPYPSAQKNLTRHLSVWYSMPEWIVQRFLETYGRAQTEEILRSFLQEDRGISLRCNTSLASVEQVVQSLEAQGVRVERGRIFEEALHIRDYGMLTGLEAFLKGWVQVQDESSLVVGYAAPVTEDSVVIDVCAAPGGKAIHLADRMRGQGLIRACDLTKDKVAAIRQNLIRTGFHNVKLKKHDATQFLPEWEETADVVVADLPCSGLGVIGHKADIKYKTAPQDIRALAVQQRKILRTAVRYLKPGGVLLYSTCTIAPEENEEQVPWILENLPLEPENLQTMLPEKLQGKTGAHDCCIQILPTDAGGDGFFLAAFRRKEQA